MSAFNIQLSFKLNIEPPENMYTFNIQPSLTLNVEPQENIFNLEPKEQEENLKVKEIAIKKELEPQPKEIVNVQEQNNGLLIQILEAKKKLIEILEEQKDILFEYVPEKDLDEVQKRFNEITVEDEPIKIKINLEVQDEVKDENEKCQEQNDTPTEIVNIQNEVEDTNLTIDKCLENSELSPTTCKTYKSKIKNMMEWVSLYDTFASKLA